MAFLYGTTKRQRQESLGALLVLISMAFIGLGFLFAIMGYIRAADVVGVVGFLIWGSGGFFLFYSIRYSKRIITSPDQLHEDG